MNTSKNYKNGFTLIELLVVIAIIGILSGIVLTAFGSVRGRARDVTRKTDLYSYRLAEEMYYATNNRYTEASMNNQGCLYDIDPSRPGGDIYIVYSYDLSGCSNFGDSIFDQTWSQEGSGLKNPLKDIMNNFPIDPLNGQARCKIGIYDSGCLYAYMVSADFKKFGLAATLENGKSYVVCSDGRVMELKDTPPGNAVQICYW